MENYLLVILWSMVGSVISLIGGVALLRLSKIRDKVILYALPFGAGALLATAFFTTLPESIEGGLDSHEVIPYALLGFLIFFMIERFAGWFHGHHEHSRAKSQSVMVVLGDTLHNAIDGVAIGIAFLVDVPTGIVTTLAIAAHEIPQEIGDFGILLGRGMKPRGVLLVNIVSALMTTVLAVITYWLGDQTQWQLGYALALAAGFFIYIAASDIIPEIHENSRKIANQQSVVLLVGVIVVMVVSMTLGHSHQGH